jgi:hypothetical protein
MGRSVITSLGLITLSLCLVNPAAAQVDPQRAEAYFKEAATICQRDGGRLWGVSLCGPMVFADARTQTLATNQPRPTEEPPRTLGFANAPFDWGGSRWAAYVWDFTTSLGDARARGILLLHELFHRIQPDLGLITPTGQNAHLDTLEGRVWLRLEWRALARARGQTGEARKRAVSDAAAFRLARRSQFANAAENERVEEIREGLAQYTGTVATATSDAEAVASALEQLAAAEQHETFLQQAYTSGVAYGILLDTASPDWRRRVRSDSDLGQMLIVALNVTPLRTRSKPRRVTVAQSSELRNKRAPNSERPLCASCGTASSMARCLSFRDAVAERLTRLVPRLFPEPERCTSCRTVRAVFGVLWPRLTAFRSATMARDGCRVRFALTEPISQARAGP